MLHAWVLAQRLRDDDDAAVDVCAVGEELLDHLSRDAQPPRVTTKSSSNTTTTNDVVVAVAYRAEVASFGHRGLAHGFDLNALVVGGLDIPAGLAKRAALALVVLRDDRLGDISSGVVVCSDDVAAAQPRMIVDQSRSSSGVPRRARTLSSVTPAQSRRGRAAAACGSGTPVVSSSEGRYSGHCSTK